MGKELKKPYSFKSLRKTGADIIQKLAGVEIAQVYLCHTPKTMAEKNYTNPHFDKLAAALDYMREQLQPMFENVPHNSLIYIVNNSLKDWGQKDLTISVGKRITSE